MDKKKSHLLGWHRWVWVTAIPIMRLLIRLHYGPYTCDPAPELEGGYIVLPNHACGGDQFFVAFSFPKKHMYFMVSEHAFRNRLLGNFMRVMTGPISRVKGGVDASAVLSLLRWLRNGVPICIFPEGNRTWNGQTAAIHPTTAKLLRTAGVPVLTYRIEGGYLTDPRWSRSLRRGRIHGSVVHVYRPEELKKMSLDEIEAAVNRDLLVDIDRSQNEEPIPYKGKRLAEGLEEALFICPKCGKVGTMHSHGNTLSCECGMSVTYNELGFFDPPQPFRSVAQWDHWQQEELKHRLDTEEPEFSDEDAEIRQLVGTHKTRVLGRGVVKLDRQGLHLGKLSFSLQDMQKPELCHLGGRETMMFSNGEGSYELCFRKKPGLRKYQLLLSDLIARQNTQTV